MWARLDTKWKSFALLGVFFIGNNSSYQKLHSNFQFNLVFENFRKVPGNIKYAFKVFELCVQKTRDVSRKSYDVK